MTDNSLLGTRRTPRSRRTPLPQWIQDLQARHKRATEAELCKIMQRMRDRAQREMERVYK